MAPQEPLLVLTGAGISAGSGVPTFRGQDGLWRNYRAEQLATPQAFETDPELVWNFYAWRRELVSRCHPNPAHRMLAELEKAHDHFNLITQNVDGLHQRAGSSKVLELHGSLWSLKCTACSTRWHNEQVPFDVIPPDCPLCGSLARPDVIWFGESLNPEILDLSFKLSSAAKTMLVIGTSAMVHPAAQLPVIAKANGARLIEINPEETTLSNRMDEVYRVSAEEGLRQWLQEHGYDL